MISTRLFCDLPAASALEAIDTVSPRPLVVPDDGSDRSSLINAAMVPALAALRAMLSGKRTVAIGVLSVWRRRPPHCPARSRSRSRSGGAAPRGPAQLRARLDAGRRCNWAGYADCRCRPFPDDRQAPADSIRSEINLRQLSGAGTGGEVRSVGCVTRIDPEIRPSLRRAISVDKGEVVRDLLHLPGKLLIQPVEGIAQGVRTQHPRYAVMGFWNHSLPKHD